MRIDSALNRARAIYAHRTAVQFAGRSQTWDELGDRVARLGGALRHLGVSPGDRVAVLGLNSDRYLEVLYAVPWIGAVVVPVNTRLAPPETRHWLVDSGASVVLVDSDFTERIADLLPELSDVAHVVALDAQAERPGWSRYDELVNGAQPVAAHEGADHDAAVIFYTGGTTGVSKGVTLSHRNVLASALQSLTALKWDHSSVYLHAAPMFHMADGLGTFAALLAGSKQTMCPRFEVNEVLRTIESKGVTCSVVVPTMIDLLVSDPASATFDLSRLRCLAFGGSPMPEAVVMRATARMPHVELYQLYGQSEASPTLTVLGPEHHVFEGPGAGKTRSAGQACIGCEVAIVDEQDLVAPTGVVGEIVGRGDNVMLGYWNLPELTSQTLRGGWLHTGDAGYIDEDGFLFVVDRVKDMIVSGGENVYCAEVENALTLHADITEAQVIGIPHADWGEAVHAIIRVRDGSAPTEREVIDHCKQHIASYKCPKSVETRVEPFPKSGAGKYLKKELRETYWSDHARRVS